MIPTPPMTASVNTLQGKIENPQPTPKAPEDNYYPETAEQLKQPPKTTETQKSPSWTTLELATQDVRRVLDQQREQSHTLTTKLNILFVTNGALLTSLSISGLLFLPSPFSIVEILGFLLNFTLLINAFLPRQVAVSPNLGDKKVLERYLVLSPDKYQLQMLVNLVETYNANRQRLEDISLSLRYSAYVTWGVVLTITLHVVAAYFIPAIPAIDLSGFS